MPSIQEVLKKVAPGANADFVRASATAGAIMAQYGITTVKGQAQVVTQCHNESGGFRVFTENLNYRAETLHKLWPKRFPALAFAETYAHQPEKIANFIYGGRNGNSAFGDGWKYRGGGMLQHTFKSEYLRCSRYTSVNLVEHPDYLRDPKNAVLMWHACCSFFKDRNIVDDANAGRTTKVRMVVNGGTIGLQNVLKLESRCEAAFAGQALPKEKTIQEQHEEAKKNVAKVAAGGSAAGAVVGTGGSTQAPTPQHASFTVGIAVGIVVVALVIAWVLWKKAGRIKELVDEINIDSLKAKIGEM